MATDNPFDVRGKNAVVTGGAMGIGFGIVKRFVGAGVNVVLVDLDGAAAKAASAKLADGPGKIITVQADVSKEGTSRAVIDRCVEEFGSIDILVNNAGIYPLMPMMHATGELLDRIYQTNLKGLALFSKDAAATMIAQGTGGKIINMASLDSFRPSLPGLVPYACSKGAILMFTRAFAVEVGPQGVQVNAIAPGTIETEGTYRAIAEAGLTPEQVQALLSSALAQIPLRRRGTPDDVAKVALFLASPAADYITGETIMVDGGWMLT